MNRLKKIFGDLESERSTASNFVSGAGSRGSLSEARLEAKDTPCSLTSTDTTKRQKHAILASPTDTDLSNKNTKEATTQRTLEKEKSFVFTCLVAPQENRGRRRSTATTKVPSSTSVLHNESSSTAVSHNDSLLPQSSFATASELLLRALELNDLESETIDSSGDGASGISSNVRASAAALVGLANRRNRPRAGRGSYAEEYRAGSHQQLACIAKRQRGSEICDEIIYRRRSSASYRRRSSRRRSSAVSVSSGASEEGGRPSKQDSCHSNSSGLSHEDSFSTLASIEAMVAKRNLRRR